MNAIEQIRYPHIIQQYNIGNETLIDDAEERADIIYELIDEIEDMIRAEKDIKRRTALKNLVENLRRDDRNIVDEIVALGECEFQTLINRNISMTPNVQFFSNEKESILSGIMRHIYGTRKTEKGKGGQAEQKVVWCKEELMKRMGKLEGESKITEEFAAVIEKLDEPALRLLMEEFDDYAAAQDALQMAYKILMNSAYGALTNAWLTEYFDIRMGEAITLAGQAINKWNIKFVNEFLNDYCDSGDYDFAFYGDTDSNYITMKKVLEKDGMMEATNDEKVDYLDNWYKENLDQPIKDFAESMCKTFNGYEQRMFWAREVIAQSAIWQAPKLYIMSVNNNEGTAYATPKLKFMGVAAKKSNYPERCRNWLKECYEICLNGTERDLQNRVREIRKEYNDLEIHEMASGTGISELDKYILPNGSIQKGAYYVSKGAILYNKQIDKCGLGMEMPYIKAGDKVKITPAKTPNPTGYHYIVFDGYLDDRLGLDKYVDYNAAFQKTFLDPLESLIDVIDWGWRKKTNFRKMGKKSIG